MSLKTALGNLRTSLKVQKEINNAQMTATVQKAKSLPVLGLPFALAFVFMLSALAVPVSAEIDLNATISPLITGITALIPSIVELVVSIVPAIIVLAVVGFIVGFLDKILSMLKF